MAGLLTFIGWVVSHWYIVAALGAIALAVAYFYMGRALIDLLRGLVEFFKTPAGQMIAIVVVGILVVSTAFSTGRNYERKLCDAEDLRDQLEAERRAHAETRRQVEAADATRRRDAERAERAEKALRENESKINETPHNPAACLDGGAARRVQSVR